MFQFQFKEKRANDYYVKKAIHSSMKNAGVGVLPISIRDIAWPIRLGRFAINIPKPAAMTPPIYRWFLSQVQGMGKKLKAVEAHTKSSTIFSVK